MSPQRQTAIQFGSWIVSHRLVVIRARIMHDLRADPMDMLMTGAQGPFRIWAVRDGPGLYSSGKPLGSVGGSLYATINQAGKVKQKHVFT